MKWSHIACVAAALAAGDVASAEACSLALWNDNGQAVVAGRTMDLFIDDQPRLVFLPRGVARHGGPEATATSWTSKYASVALTAFDAGTSDGLNEAGLGAHLLYLHGSEHQPVDARPTLSNLLWAQYALDNFQSVAEALEGLEKLRIVSGLAHGREWPLHLAIQDASGDSAVIEFVDGKQVIHHGREVTVMTNEPPLAEQLANLKEYKLFGGARAMPGDVDPQSRFVRAASFLKTLSKPANPREAVTHLAGVMRTVSSPFGSVDTSGGDATDAWPTRWASIIDHSEKVYYVSLYDNPNVFWVDLTKLDPQGKKILALNPHDETLGGEVSAKLLALSPVDKAFPPDP